MITHSRFIFNTLH